MSWISCDLDAAVALVEVAFTEELEAKGTDLRRELASVRRVLPFMLFLGHFFEGHVLNLTLPGRKTITSTDPEWSLVLEQLLNRKPSVIPNRHCGGSVRARGFWRIS